MNKANDRLKITQYMFRKYKYSKLGYVFLVIINKSMENFTVPPSLSVSAAA
jgi:hypothetical protein